MKVEKGLLDRYGEAIEKGDVLEAMVAEKEEEIERLQGTLSESMKKLGEIELERVMMKVEQQSLINREKEMAYQAGATVSKETELLASNCESCEGEVSLLVSILSDASDTVEEMELAHEATKSALDASREEMLKVESDKEMVLNSMDIFADESVHLDARLSQTLGIVEAKEKTILEKNALLEAKSDTVIGLEVTITGLRDAYAMHLNLES